MIEREERTRIESEKAQLLAALTEEQRLRESHDERIARLQEMLADTKFTTPAVVAHGGRNGKAKADRRRCSMGAVMRVSTSSGVMPGAFMMILKATKRLNMLARWKMRSMRMLVNRLTYDLLAGREPMRNPRPPRHDYAARCAAASAMCCGRRL